MAFKFYFKPYEAKVYYEVRILAYDEHPAYNVFDVEVLAPSWPYQARRLWVNRKLVDCMEIPAHGHDL